MQFVFLDMSGKTLFIRDDAERAEWRQEEYTLDLEFPYLPKKVISIGQRIFFKDPDTKDHQIFEVKQAQTIQPDGYQSIVAEHICVSELSDEHMDSVEITDETARNALSSILENTLWRVSTAHVNPVSSGNLSRGSVWQNVLLIKDNWNVYIEPKVTLADDGTITRNLNIFPTDGIYQGIRLSIDKNFLDPCVTYDDSELYTALWGYGGSTPSEETTGEDTVCDFSEVVWEKTDQHPAKPEGQKYLEDPDATTTYGRNGRARYGFYQNNDITDPEVLLQKTWETLQTVSKPLISIEGTVADLYRFGYADEPLRLHGIALVEILPSGYKQQIQIIRMTVNLLDPSATTVTIGSYIPNIIYINKETDDNATGGRGGGGKNTSDETTWREFRTTIETYQNGTGMKFKSVQNDITRQDEELSIQQAEIELSYSMIRQEVQDRRDADGVLSSKITQTATEIRSEVSDSINGVNSTISQTASQIRAEVSDSVNGLQSSITQTASQIRSEVSDSVNGLQSSITQTASQIRAEVAEQISGYSSVIEQTASQIRQEVSDSVNSLNASITVTASQIRQEVSNSVNGLNSSITQTASQIRAEVSDSVNGLSSSITQTATQIRQEVSDTANGLSSSITSTATQIRAEVSDSANALSAAITTTASQIRQEVSDTANGLSSSITSTATQIRAEVSDADNGIKSSISVQKDRIDLVVHGSGNDAYIRIGKIVDGINGQTGSYTKIVADTINLSGYVTMSSFNALSGSVDGVLAAGTFGSNSITSNQINATGTLAASSTFNYKGHTIGTYACKTTSDVTFYALGYT